MRLHLAVVRDFRAEGWPSMDLCADQLLTHLPASIAGLDIAPRFRCAFSLLPRLGRAGFNIDRLLNRHLILPHVARSLLRRADFVHIADHSYAHLALALPAGRVGVYCHDLDAFRCLIEPAKDPRPRWFRRIAQRTLAGLQRAAVVFHSTLPVRDDLLRFGVIDSQRLVHAPYGTAAEFAPNGSVAEQPAPYLLHVGNDMPRKRLDVLLDMFAEVRRRTPSLALVQVGPPWSGERQAQITHLGIGESVVKRSNLTRGELASLYRGAAAVLVPSEAEGFGLPVIEALACGAAVVASDIPVLREVGGPAVVFCPVGNVSAWADVVGGVLNGNVAVPSRPERVARAGQFSWTAHAATIADAYQTLARA